MQETKRSNLIPFILLIIVLIIAAVVIFMLRPDDQQAPPLGQEGDPNATTTVEANNGGSNEQTGATSQPDATVADGADTSGAGSSTGGSPGSTGGGSTGSNGVEVTVEQPSQPAALGPRQPAGSPAAALAFFVEAMNANNIDRAVSYFHANVQSQYRASFADGSPSQHVIVRAYQNGTVDPVELVNPDEGVYEIAVYPQGGTIPFRTRYMYDASVEEFVIWEL